MKKKLIILSTILLTFIFSTTILATRVFADCGDVETSLIDCPNLGGGTPRYLAMDIVNILSVGIGIIGVIGISIFGIQILTARDDPARVANARKRFFQILLGLGVYLAMWTGLNWLLPGGVIFGRIPVESIKLSPTIANIAVGKTDKLIAAFQPLDADDQTLKWESSDESIATVDEFGNVTGKALGEVTIKATAVNGSTSESTVNIIANADLPAYCSASSGGTDGTTPQPATETAQVESTSDTPYVEGLEIHFVSTGHDDDAILIRTKDTVVVIDGGRCDGGATCTTGLKFVNYMKTAGVTKIDALIGSHAHWNHIQSHSVIVKNIPTSSTYYPVNLNTCIKEKLCETRDIQYVLDTLKEKNLTPNFLDISAKTQILTVGDLRFFIIGPPKPRKGNKGSFVFIMQYGEKRFMFTGDQEWDGLSQIKNGKNSALDLLKSRAESLGTNLKVDFFKWPHHGYNDSQFKESDEKAFFNEINASYIVVPNSNSCGGSQVNYAVNKLGLKKYSNCGKTNLVITSDGQSITFHENQSPENWVPKKTVGESGKVSSTPATPQSCIPVDSTEGGKKVATSEGDATFINGNGCDNKTIFPGTKYSLTETQIKLVAHRVQKENCGSAIGCRAEATQIVNLYESKKPNEPHTTENFWNWFRTTGWYATPFSGLSASQAKEKGINAVRDVVVNGNRILPPKVVGHDTLEFNYPGYKYNITGFYDANGNRQSLTKSNVDQLIPGKTKLTRRNASDKTFWCIIRYENNKFGDPFTF